MHKSIFQLHSCLRNRLCGGTCVCILQQCCHCNGDGRGNCSAVAVLQVERHGGDVGQGLRGVVACMQRAWRWGNFSGKPSHQGSMQCQNAVHRRSAGCRWGAHGVTSALQQGGAGGCLGGRIEASRGCSGQRRPRSACRRTWCGNWARSNQMDRRPGPGFRARN